MRALLAGLALLCFATIAQARPYTIDDMLALEGYGQVLISPNGARAIVERQGRYESAQRFTYGYFVRRLSSRVMVFDLTGGSILRPAFPQSSDAGYWAGDFSPRGNKLTVFRLRKDRLRLGTADLASGSVRWFQGAPDLPLAAPAPTWLDDHHIAYTRFISERLPLVLDFGGAVQRRLRARWSDAARGVLPSADFANSSATNLPANEMRELVILNIATGKARVLLRGVIDEFVVAPSKLEAAVITLDGSVQPDPGVPMTLDYQSRHRRLQVIDLRSGQVRSPCAACDLRRQGFAYSLDNDLAFQARLDGRPWAGAGLWISHSGLSARRLSGSDPGRFIWVGQKLLVRTAGAWELLSPKTGSAPSRVRPSEFVAATGRSAWLMDRAGLWLLDERGELHLEKAGEFKRAGLDYLDASSTGLRTLREPSSPVVRESLPAHERVSFGFDDGRSWSMTIDRDTAVLAISRGSGTAIGVATDEHGVGRLSVYSANAPPRLVDRISLHLAQIDLPEKIALIRKGAGGAVLTDWLFLPRGATHSALVVLPYQGSVHGPEMPYAARPNYFGSASNVMLLVANGYGVLLPSLPPGPGGAPQETLVRDVDAAIDSAIATGRVDRQRLAIYGHSYGGVNALTLAAKTTRFRAIIAASGSADLAASYGAVPPAQRLDFSVEVPLGLATAWYETGQGRLGVPPWVDPSRYQAASSFYEIAKMTTPMLLIGGDLDYVPMEQAERLFISLRRLGRDVSLLRFYGEGHVVQSPANIRLQWKTVLDFLRRTMSVQRRRGQRSLQ